VGRIRLGAALAASAEQSYQNALLFGLELDNVHVQLKRKDGTIAGDTVVNFAVDQSEIRIDLAVTLRATEETMRVVVALRTAAVAFFSGAQDLVVRAGQSVHEPTTVSLGYVGPDAGATTLSLAPSVISLFTNDSVTFVATALNANQQPVQLVAVDWSVRNSALGTVSSGGLFKPSLLRGETYVVAQLPTGLRDSARVAMIPLPSQIAPISGGGQIGLVGILLPNPIVIELRAADNLPVAGFTVDFAVTGGGGSISVSRAVTDGNGRASTTLTLGLLPGVNMVTVSATGVPPITVSATASLSIP
jgi:hypothetical protein